MESPKIVDFSEIHTAIISELTIHATAESNASASDIAIQSLADDIELNGQLQPIFLFRNKFIIDGRNRLQAMKHLKLTNITYYKVKHKATYEELKMLAQSSEIRRHETKSQLAIKAWKYKNENNVSLREAARVIGATNTNVSSCNIIAEKYGTKALEDLFTAGEHKLPNGRMAHSLSQITSFIKAEEDAAKINRDGKRTTPFLSSSDIDVAKRIYNSIIAQKKEIKEALYSALYKDINGIDDTIDERIQFFLDSQSEDSKDTD